MSSSSIPPTSLTTSGSPGLDSTHRGRKPAPVFISVNRADVDPIQLRDLLGSCGLSCHRFPRLGPDGLPEPVDINKLRTALDNSNVVVSAFSSSQFATGDDSGFSFKALFGRAILVPLGDRRLVGFGRAVSDGGLTASIHDVAVLPSLQRLGIGRKIVQRIIRILSAKDIYDISVLCSEKERLFFKACSFGDDVLGSTTMMYMKTASIYPAEYPLATHAGRLVLSVPLPPKASLFKRRPVDEGVDHDINCQ